MKWLKHAFAVEGDKPFEPDEKQRELADRVCREVVRRRMTTPALMVLEMSRPLNYLSAQVMHFFGPIVTVLVDPAGYQAFAAMLEHRGSIDFLVHRLEEIEAEAEKKPGKEEKPDEEAGDRKGRR